MNQHGFKIDKIKTQCVPPGAGNLTTVLTLGRGISQGKFEFFQFSRGLPALPTLVETIDRCMNTKKS